METGLFSVVGTPIGNLEDITLRALRVLKEADYVLCEDTRVTGKLLHHHGIKAKMKRYDAHASVKTHEEVMADLESGLKVALVSDAGTPGISDPGVLLIQQARAAGHKIEAIPGASAITTAFSIAGIVGNQFSFWGFVPQKKGRETFFKKLADQKETVTFFESVHRIEKTLESLVKFLPASATVSVGRELTKMHEEMVVGDHETVRAYFKDNPGKVKGEFVVMVSFS